MRATQLGKIAVVGSGSIGLFYGARLAASGGDVHFLMRSGFDEARQRGICVYSADVGDIRIERPKVFREAHEIGPCDLVVISLKATANRSLGRLLPPLLRETTALITLQNGLGNEEYLACLHGAERVLGGLCFVCLTRRTPASVDHFGHGMLSIGEFARAPLPRTRRLVGAFCESGVEAKLVHDLAAERWRKLVWNIPFNGLAVAEGGLSVDRILAIPALNARCRALMRETILAATALGHFIETEYAELQIERTYPMGAYKPSTLVDWLAGKELEIEAIWGEPLRQATRAGLSVPNLEALYNRLRSLPVERV
ncbi:MAG TPA: 2-dehydropantoate 2-reductase [Terrimicrobiaceae bacterium]|nr:2-dehydropantoate 2-reductase [Terrimicrobiaceae bacterium]